LINKANQPCWAYPKAGMAGARSVLASSHMNVSDATINYGVFFNALSDFLIVAFTVFMLVRQVNRLKSEQQASVPMMRDCPFCLSAVAIKATRCPHCTSPLTAT
jgi:large conductance mechanosensitive channel